MKTKITISFKSKNQTPLLMIIREYWEAGEVEYAEVLFSIETNLTFRGLWINGRN